MWRIHHGCAAHVQVPPFHLLIGFIKFLLRVRIAHLGFMGSVASMASRTFCLRISVLASFGFGRGSGAFVVFGIQQLLVFRSALPNSLTRQFAHDGRPRAMIALRQSSNRLHLGVSKSNGQGVHVIHGYGDYHNGSRRCKIILDGSRRCGVIFAHEYSSTNDSRASRGAPSAVDRCHAAREDISDRRTDAADTRDSGMKVQTRMGRGRRIWVCPICDWRETVSTRRKHIQTGQPLTREQQVATLAFRAEQHFRAQHINAFMGPTPK